MQAIVIDDSRAMRGILRRALTSLGYTVAEATDGQDGLKKLAEIPTPDIAMVDWNMPNMNGYEFICEVRKLPKYADMKIVMVTTEVEMHQVEKAITAGANEYVMKPFTEQGLLEKLSLLGIGQEAA